MRIFDNPNNLPASIILNRLNEIDSFAIPYAYTRRETNVNTYYVSIQSQKTDNEITILLQSAATAAELSVINDSNTATTQLRAEYQVAVARLEQIQAAQNPTNAQVVQAIKDLALYQEKILKYLAKNIV